ncbi:methyl-accepting chemotaxis protein, partial [bacterium]|nr:methyl-accepting chemotaxis protein [bacterium]
MVAQQVRARGRDRRGDDRRLVPLEEQRLEERREHRRGEDAGRREDKHGRHGEHQLPGVGADHAEHAQVGLHAGNVAGGAGRGQAWPARTGLKAGRIRTIRSGQRPERRRRSASMSVKLLLGIAMGTLVMLLLGSIGFTTSTLDGQKADGLRINLAGRQRMLSQKMAKEALVLQQTPAGPAREEARTRLAGTVGLFDRTLAALHHGGVTQDGAGKDVTLPPAKDRKVTAALDEGLQLWTEIKRPLDQTLAAGADPGAGTGALTQKNLDLMKKMDAATTAFQVSSDARRAGLTRLQAATVVVALLVAGGIFLLVHRQLVMPLVHTAGYSRRVADGDLAERLAATGSRELRELAASMNGMSASLSGTVREITRGAEDLTHSAEALLDRARQVSGTAGGVVEELHTVGSAVEEVSASMRAVAGNTDGIDGAISTIAA